LAKKNALITEHASWTQHEPKPILENSNFKLLWDQNIYTDNKISARRPDMIIFNKIHRRGYIVDINCPNDTNVYKNEGNKMQKYTELKIELERVWRIHFTVVPVVVGCLGAVSMRLSGFLRLIGLDDMDIIRLQEIVLLASCRIMRRCLTQSGVPIEW
jgi:hypothetical protein